MNERIFNGELRAAAESFARREHGLLIGGQWRPAASGNTLDTFNPATKARLGTIAAAGLEDVEHAAEAASQAFETA